MTTCMTCSNLIHIYLFHSLDTSGSHPTIQWQAIWKHDNQVKDIMMNVLITIWASNYFFSESGLISDTEYGSPFKAAERRAAALFVKSDSENFKFENLDILFKWAIIPLRTE